MVVYIVREGIINIAMDKVRELIERGKTIQEILNLPEHYREKVLSQLRVEDPALAMEVEEEIRKRKDREELIAKAKQVGIIKKFGLEKFIEEEFDMNALREAIDEYIGVRKIVVYSQLLIVFAFLMLFFAPLIPIVYLSAILVLGYYIYKNIRLQSKIERIRKPKKE